MNRIEADETGKVTKWGEEWCAHDYLLTSSRPVDGNYLCPECGEILSLMKTEDRAILIRN